MTIGLKEVSLGLVLVGFLAGSLQAADQYAAIAASRTVQRIGTANNQLSAAAARDAALADCAIEDCIIAASVKNGCAAAAFSLPTESEYTWSGFGTDTNKDGAEKLALQICEYDAHGSCQVEASLCTQRAR